MNYFGRKPLRDGTKLICKNGDVYTICGAPIGAGSSSIVYPAIQKGEESLLAIKECYPMSGVFQRNDTFFRKQGIVESSTTEGTKRLTALLIQMQREKEYSQRIYNRTICIVKMAHQIKAEKIRIDGNDYNAEKGIFFLMDDVRKKSISLQQLLDECKKDAAEGHSLRRGGLPSVHVTAKVISEVLNALNRMHTADDFGGYIHGDIQENNVFFQNSDLVQGNIGIACMLDLGCMQKIGPDGFTKELDRKELFSTPGYIPPEMIYGDRIVKLSVRADIYSLGRLFLYMLTGKQHLDSNRDRVYYDRTLRMLLPSEGIEIGCKERERRFVNQILDRALAFDPLNRYASALEMKNDIDKLREMTASQKYSMIPNLPGLATFTGRELEIRQLDEMIARGENPVWIYGFGGIGKSELAIQLGLKMRSDGRKDVYRIIFRKNLKETICAIKFTGDEDQENLSGDAKYQYNMNILASHFKDCLLIIDDFDCRSEGLEKILRSKPYQELIRQPFTVLFTTRYDLKHYGLSSVEAGTLSEEELLKLMQSFYTVGRKKIILKKLIHEVGSHTLTAELIARMLETERAEMTPEQLLDYLRNNQLKRTGLSQVMSNKNREYRQETIYKHLLNLFRINKLNEIEKIALTHAIFLAPEGMDKSIFMDCEEEKYRSGLTECLLPRGWITCDSEEKLSLHPLIRELCSQELATYLKKEYFSEFHSNICKRCDLDEVEDYRHFFDFAGYLMHSGSWFEDSRISGYAGELFLKIRAGRSAVIALNNAIKECNDEYQLEKSILFSDMCYAYGLLGRGQTARVYGRKALKIQEQLFPEEKERIATTCNNLHMAYQLLGDYSKMLAYSQRALTIRENIDIEDRIELAISYNNVGSAYESNADYVRALPYYEKAILLCKRIFTSEHPYLAIFFNNAGKCCLVLKDYAKAGDYLSRALQINQKLLPPSDYALIASYLNMANLLERNGDLDQGLICVEEAVKRVESSEPVNQLLLAHCYFNYSYFLDRKERYPLALEYGERALKIRQRYLPEDHSLIAESCYNLKCLCIRMGEIAKANEYSALETKIKSKKTGEEI